MSEIDRLVKGLEELQRTRSTCLLDTDWGTIITITSTLQLSLRHPKLPTLTRGVVRRFVDRVIDSIGEEVPDLAAALRLGDDPRYDQ